MLLQAWQLYQFEGSEKRPFDCEVDYAVQTKMDQDEAEIGGLKQKTYITPFRWQLVGVRTGYVWNGHSPLQENP